VNRKHFARHFHKAADIALSLRPIADVVAPKLLSSLMSGERRYGAPIMTMKCYFGEHLILRVDPATIMHVALQRDTYPGKAGLGPRYLISSGDWDIQQRPIRFSVHIDEIMELFEMGLEYERTSAFRTRIDRMRAGDPTRHRTHLIDTEQKVHDYYKQQLELIESIRKNGYLSRHDVMAGGHFDETQLDKAWLARERDENEIGCAVARDGELQMFRTGHHRLAIAVALKLKRIYVEVLHLHKDWVIGEMNAQQTGPAAAIMAGLGGLSTANESV
jgi:hypothetical protein